MSFLISDALAQAPAAAQQQPSGLGQLLFLVGIFVLFYFLLIRPQSKRAKEHRKLVSELQKGDEVVTTGGLLGKISELDDNFLTLEIAQGVQIKVQRQAVAALMPKGTY